MQEFTARTFDLMLSLTTLTAFAAASESRIKTTDVTYERQYNDLISPYLNMYGSLTCGQTEGNAD
jgi:hypothetical protein